MKYFLATLALIFGLFLTPHTATATGLTFWTTEIQEDRIETIRFLANAYMLTQDDVTVDVVSVNENHLAERMKAANGSATAPHLVGAGSQLLVALCERGYLDSATATRVIRKIGVDRFYPGSLRLLAAPGGKQWYGVPFHGWVQGLWYRADWFREAGLAPPDSWEAIVAAAEHFADPAQGRYGIVVGTTEGNYAAQVFTHLARANGVSMFGPDGRVTFDSRETVDTLKLYARLAELGPQGPQSWRARDYFLQGKLAMLFYSTFIMDDLALAGVAADSLTGDNFEELDGAPFDPDLVNRVRMVPFIRKTRQAAYGTINGFGIRKDMNESERQAVESFLAFLYEPAHYVAWLHMAPGGMMPVLRDVAGSDRFLADPPGIFRRYGRDKVQSIIEGLSSIDTFGMVDGTLHPASSVVFADFVIARMIRRTVFEGMPASESVSQAARKIEAIAASMDSR